MATTEAAARLSRLRAREREILAAYSLGLTTSEVAEVFVLSPHTVRTHVKLAMRRLSVSSRAEAVVLIGEASDDALVQLSARRIAEPVRRWLGAGNGLADLRAVVDHHKGATANGRTAL